jgi:hypothetical protein
MKILFHIHGDGASSYKLNYHPLVVPRWMARRCGGVFSPGIPTCIYRLCDDATAGRAVGMLLKGGNKLWILYTYSLV